MILVPLPTHERFKKSDAQNCFHLFFCGTLERRRLASTNFLRRFQTKTSFAQRNSFLGQSPTLSVATSCFKTLWMTSNKTRCAIFWLDLCGFVTSDIKVQLLTLFEENWKLNVFYVKSQQGSVAPSCAVASTQLIWRIFSWNSQTTKQKKITTLTFGLRYFCWDLQRLYFSLAD